MTADGRDTLFRFGGLVVAPAARQVSLDQEPVMVGSRAFDLLLVLLQRHGTLVSKREIMERVWPDTIVEENCLRVHIAALRKALGPYGRAIRTVAGRGYVWTEVTEIASLGRAPIAGAERSCEVANVPRWAAVIDDDAGVCEAVCGLIESVGIEARPFASVVEFLKRFEPTEPACFVLDVRLPGRSGLDFLEDLAARDMKIPIICMSGYADVPMSVRAMKAGAREFLLKPLRHQDLVDAIQRVVPVVP